jgi:uncharacterized membrane protein
MSAEERRRDRVATFSDGVFAVVITILVLELRPPASASFSALLSLWPTALSYAVSYLFIAVVWVNHHHLFGYAESATRRLVWSNFAHLFSVRLYHFQPPGSLRPSSRQFPFRFTPASLFW